MPMSPRLLRPRASGLVLPTDADARAYVLAVNTADGQPLEAPVVQAIDAFVIGCKADGIWSAIKSSCILMGARTLAGALTPLAGPTPTNSNFVATDYSRRTGLIGDGSTKRLFTNYAQNNDAITSAHGFVWLETGPTAGTGVLFATGWLGRRFMMWTPGAWNTNGSNFELWGICNGTSAFQQFRQRFFGGWGVERTNSDNFVLRYGSTPETFASPAVATLDATAITLFHAVPVYWGNPRISFYSFGSGLSLATLESRVATLRSQIQAVT